MKRLLFLALLLACEGPVGPAGEDGTDGKDGVANISVVIFSVLSNQWTEITPEIFEYYKACTSSEQRELLGSKTKRHISCFQGLADASTEASFA